MENGTTLFSAGLQHKGHIFVCLHGAGYSGASYACLAGEVKKFATIIAFDFRGHGFNKMIQAEDMSSDRLVVDTIAVFKYLHQVYPKRTMIIVGHRYFLSIFLR